MWWDAERVPELAEVREVVCACRGNQPVRGGCYGGLGDGADLLAPDPGPPQPVRVSAYATLGLPEARTFEAWLRDEVASAAGSAATPLKVAIVGRGWSQVEVAERLGCSPFRLSRLVRGRLAPTIREEARLAQILRLPYRLLFPPQKP